MKILFAFLHKDNFLSVAGEEDGHPLDFGHAELPDHGQEAGQDCVEDGSSIALAQLALFTTVHRGGSAGFLCEWGGQAERDNQQTYNSGGGWRQEEGNQCVGQGALG